MLKGVHFIFALAGLLILILVGGCTKKQNSGAANEGALDPLVLKGEQVYVANCLSCHGADPKKDGPIGPSVWGSSLELIKAKVLKGDYPLGHSAKRTTKIMVALPHLQADLDAVHAYLNK